jgi:hypothetical protein
MAEPFTLIIVFVALSAIIAVGWYARHRQIATRAAMSPHERALHAAERELRDVTRVYTQRVVQAEKELRSLTSAYNKRLTVATGAVAHATLVKNRGEGQRFLGSYRGKKGWVKLWEHEIRTPEGSARFTDGLVEAIVDTAGNLAVTKRATLTRFVALGGIGALVFKKTEKHDARELYLLIEAPAFATVIACRPDKGAEVRQFAAKITTTARTAMTAVEKRAQGLEEAQQTLTTIRNDDAALKAIAVVRATLEAARADRAAIEAAETKMAAARAAYGH